LSGSENFQISRTGGSLVLTSFKDPESMVLWFRNFSNIQTRWFFDSEGFQIESMVLWFWRFSNRTSKLMGITKKIKYPPHIGFFFPRWPGSHWLVPLWGLPLVSICDIKSTSGNPCCTLELALVEPVTIRVGWVSDLQCYILGFRVEFLWIETKLSFIYLFVYLFC
jgi:hypothetical protein